MGYSIEEIRVINQQGIAERNQVYYTDNGEAFVGTPTGRLERVTSELVNLQNDFENLKAEKVIETNTFTERVETIIVDKGEVGPEQGSYFYLNRNNDLSPLLDIHDILEDNVYELKANGDIQPFSGNDQDEFFEVIEGNLVPKNLFPDDVPPA